MIKIYTVGTRLYGGGDTLLDAHTLQFAYRSHENACKALEDLKKAHMLSSGYKPTESPTTLQKRGDYTDTIFKLEFVITEHYLSDYEEKEF